MLGTSLEILHLPRWELKKKKTLTTCIPLKGQQLCFPPCYIFLKTLQYLHTLVTTLQNVICLVLGQIPPRVITPFIKFPRHLSDVFLFFLLQIFLTSHKNLIQHTFYT